MYKDKIKKTNTKFIGVKEFRQNMNMYVKDSQENGSLVVVMNRSNPLFTLVPYDNEEDLEYTDEIIEAVRCGKADVAAGRVFTEEEMFAKYT